ncbi:kell blood group glycoprotein [Myripristis murdjan]|uniref:kell blood group glycoprotein n=1 Tax=Myripristis murdjan TaxID=586833 RepID=UPI0011761F1E|nr:kell blood group glycoprotein-like [Myripristis murdjan]
MRREVSDEKRYRAVRIVGCQRERRRLHIRNIKSRQRKDRECKRLENQRTRHPSMKNMNKTPTDLEYQPSPQPSSQPESERGPQLLPLLQLPLLPESVCQAQQEVQLQSQQQLRPLSQQSHLSSQSESQPLSLPESHEFQPQLGEEAKPVCPNHRWLLLFLMGSSLCAIILCLICYTQQNLQTESKATKKTGIVSPCLSPACQMASAHLSMSVDPFTQPCDYFLFTCGSDSSSPASRGRQRDEGTPGLGEKTVQSKKRRGSKEREDTSLREETILDRKTALLQYLRKLLESDNRSTGSAVQKAKRFYYSCLDTKSIETAGAEPFLTLIQRLGGWSVSGQWNQTDFNSTLSLLMKDYFTFPFFNLYVGKDPNEIARGTNRKYIQIDQPDLMIPIEWNSKTQKSQANTQTLRPFLALCERYLALLGAPSRRTHLHVGVFISLSSELAVSAAPLSHRLMTGQLYQRMTIKDLQTQAPAIDWLGCLQTAFHPHSISQDDHVLLHNIPYIKQMSHVIGKWLNKHELSSSGPLHTYMVLNLLHTFIPALDSRFSETERNFSVALGNSDRVAPRWKRCVLETEKGFHSILTHLLSKRIAHREAEEIIQNIFSAFKSNLVHLNWRDQTSRQFVMNKVQSLTPRLWTKAEIPSEAELDELFSKVTVRTNDYFSNYIQLLSLQQKRRNKLFAQTDGVDILSVTPFLLGNDLIFPMGMFVPPLFHPTYPRAMNYGVLGSLIAKDILHLLLPDIHSQSETVQAVGDCVWAHYLTLTENAGRGGTSSLSAAQQQEMWVQYSALQIALKAYHQSLKKHPGDTSLSGLSHIHLFLTSFSQANCDSDPFREFMPLEPSFLITVICAKSELCPTSLKCSNKTQQHLLPSC